MQEFYRRISWPYALDVITPLSWVFCLEWIHELKIHSALPRLPD